MAFLSAFLSVFVCPSILASISTKSANNACSASSDFWSSVINVSLPDDNFFSLKTLGSLKVLATAGLRGDLRGLDGGLSSDVASSSLDNGGGGIGGVVRAADRYVPIDTYQLGCSILRLLHLLEALVLAELRCQLGILLSCFSLAWQILLVRRLGS